MAEAEAHDPHDGSGEHAHTTHEAEELGPINVVAWGFAALGIVLGLVVAVAFVAATG